MIGAFLAAGFQNNAFQVGDQPVPSVWGDKGGLEKRKHPLKQNEKPAIEQAIFDAIDKVTGVQRPEPFVIQQTSKAESAEQERRKLLLALYTFDELQLQKQAKALNQSIEEYRLALAQAEIDDEEALLLLL